MNTRYFIVYCAIYVSFYSIVFLYLYVQNIPRDAFLYFAYICNSTEFP